MNDLIECLICGIKRKRIMTGLIEANKKPEVRKRKKEAIIKFSNTKEYREKRSQIARRRMVEHPELYKKWYMAGTKAAAHPDKIKERMERYYSNP